VSAAPAARLRVQRIARVGVQRLDAGQELDVEP
jgi:hypothetical protein